MATKEQVHKNIRTIRKALGYTQVEMANILGIKRPTLGSYEEGRANPPIEILYLFASYGKTTVDKIMWGNGGFKIPINGKSPKEHRIIIELKIVGNQVVARIN